MAKHGMALLLTQHGRPAVLPAQHPIRKGRSRQLLRVQQRGGRAAGPAPGTAQKPTGFYAKRRKTDGTHLANDEQCCTTNT